MSDCNQNLKKRIAQLEAELQAQRRRITAKYGQEFLALVDGNPNIRVIVTDIVEKVVFQDKEGNIISPDRQFVSG